jgi:hypothetical protein
MVKKIFGLILAVSVLSGVLAGCSGGGEPAAEGTKAPAEGEKKEEGK